MRGDDRPQGMRELVKSKLLSIDNALRQCAQRGVRDDASIVKWLQRRKATRKK